MKDLEIGKRELEENEELKLVVVKEGEIIYRSEKKGIRPLYDLALFEEIDVTGATLVDRVIGKGAVLLADYLKFEQVYGELMSLVAMDKLEKTNIKFSYKNKTDYIENKDRSDLCPVEKMSRNIESGKELLEKLTEFFNE